MNKLRQKTIEEIKNIFFFMTKSKFRCFMKTDNFSDQIFWFVIVVVVVVVVVEKVAKFLVAINFSRLLPKLIDGRNFLGQKIFS